MKRIIKFIIVISLLFVSLIGCKKEITLEPISEDKIVEYLKEKDPTLDNDEFIEASYTINTRTCDKKTDDLIVSFKGNCSLFNYEAKYKLKFVATENGWIMENFEILESTRSMKQITVSMLVDLISETDPLLIDTSDGSYSITSLDIKDDVIKFVLEFVSLNGNYTTIYNGIAVIKDGKLELIDLEDYTIPGSGSGGSSSSSSSGGSSEGSTATTLSSNYDPNKKANDYGYKAPTKQKFSDEEQSVANFIEDIKPEMVVTKVKKIGSNGISEYHITYQNVYKYIKDVYVQLYNLYWDGSSYSVVYNEILETYLYSNFEGVYVNKANGSYIIMHEDWKFELHEFYMDGSTIKKVVLKEYYRIDNETIKLQNRDKVFKSVWSSGAEPEAFTMKINSINEIKLNVDILSSKAGDKFVKVAE